MVIGMHASLKAAPEECLKLTCRHQLASKDSEAGVGAGSDVHLCLF